MFASKRHSHPILRVFSLFKNYIIQCSSNTLEPSILKPSMTNWFVRLNKSNQQITILENNGSLTHFFQLKSVLRIKYIYSKSVLSKQWLAGLFPISFQHNFEYIINWILDLLNVCGIWSKSHYLLRLISIGFLPQLLCSSHSFMWLV